MTCICCFNLSICRQDMLWTACYNKIQETSKHECITHWKQENQTYFITRIPNRSQYSCYSYTSSGSVFVFQMLGSQCGQDERNKFSFNLTVHGECETNNVTQIAKEKSLNLLLVLLLLISSRHNV